MTLQAESNLTRSSERDMRVFKVPTRRGGMWNDVQLPFTRGDDGSLWSKFCADPVSAVSGSTACRSCSRSKDDFGMDTKNDDADICRRQTMCEKRDLRRHPCTFSPPSAGGRPCRCRGRTQYLFVCSYTGTKYEDMETWRESFVYFGHVMDLFVSPRVSHTRTYVKEL